MLKRLRLYTDIVIIFGNKNKYDFSKLSHDFKLNYLDNENYFKVVFILK